MSQIITKDKIVKEIQVFLDRNDLLENACRWAIFTIEPDALALSIRSDGGNMSYQWQNIGDNSAKGFYKFLASIDKDYFLRKMSNETVFNFDASVSLLLKYADDETRPGYAEHIRNMEPCSNQHAFAEQLMENEFFHSDDLECIQHDYPAGHRAVADIFVRLVQPELMDIAANKQEK